MLEEQLNNWLQQPLTTLFPYQVLIDEYLRVGKHFVDSKILDKLAEGRQKLKEHHSKDNELEKFLDVLLDKRDEKYDYPTYLALSLLPLPGTRGESNFEEAVTRRDQVAALLLIDALQFELDAFDGKEIPLPQMRPDADLVTKRALDTLRALKPILQRMNILVPEIHPHDYKVIGIARCICAQVNHALKEVNKQFLSMTMLPVYTLHDEYMFLRVLQSFETNFALLSFGIQNVIQALDKGEIAFAIQYLQACAQTLQEANPIFWLLDTMRVEAFRDFRQYTEGASAIQSRGYKTLESLCRRPDADRLDSSGYYSVPDVRNRVLNGQATLEDAWARMQEKYSVSEADSQLMESIMKQFEKNILQWRKTHYGIAVRMLGDETGTGYTAGTPYLKSVLKIPLFCPARAALTHS